MIHILILYSTPGLADIVRAIWSVKAKMTPAESVFSLRRHATPGHHWRCLFWLSSSESKRPRGTKPKAYPLCMGNNEKAPYKCNVGGRASRTVTAWLSSREITLICSQDLHRDAEESSALWPSTSICCTWWNYNFHYLIDPIISQARICLPPPLNPPTLSPPTSSLLRKRRKSRRLCRG